MESLKQMLDTIDYYRVPDSVATRLFSKKYLLILYLEHSKKLLDFAYDKIKLSAKEFADLLESAFYTALVYRQDEQFIKIATSISKEEIDRFYKIRFISAAFFIAVVAALTVYTKDIAGLVPMLFFARMVYPAYLMRNEILPGAYQKHIDGFFDNIKLVVPLPDHPIYNFLAVLILFPAFSPLSILLRFFTESIIISYHKIFNKTHHLRSFSANYSFAGLYSYGYLLYLAYNFGSGTVGGFLTCVLMFHNILFVVFGAFRNLPDGLKFLIDEDENRLMFLPYFLMRFDPALYQKVIPKARKMDYLNKGILEYIYKDYYTKVMFCEELCPLTNLPYFNRKNLEKRLNALWHGSYELKEVIGTYLRDKSKRPPKIYLEKYLEAHSDHKLYDLGAIKYVELECVHIEFIDFHPPGSKDSHVRLNRYYFKIHDDLYIAVIMFNVLYNVRILEPVIIPDENNHPRRFPPRILTGEEFRAIKNRNSSTTLVQKQTSPEPSKNKEELLNEYMKRLELYNLD